jgi:riboflavin transporter FmnP
MNNNLWSTVVSKVTDLWNNVVSNVTYVLEFLAIIIVLFLAAFLLEKLAMKKRGVSEKIFSTRKMAMIGMFSAISTILMLFDISVFFAPEFYKLDFSELPILIGTFAFGPAAGVMMEFVKILLKLFIKGTSHSAPFVGELANFVIGCSFILPASAVYAFKKNKKTAIIACIAGTLTMTIFGTAFNAIYLLPVYATLFGMPLDSILALGAVNPLLKEGSISIVSFVAACVAPLNLIKGLSVSLITLLIYKRLSPIIKAGANNSHVN